MSKTAWSLVVAVAFCVSSASLHAEDLPRFSAEGRFGFINVQNGEFLDLGQGNHFSAGFLASYRPSTSAHIWNRFTGRFSFDGGGLGGQDITTGIKDVERLYLVNFALGFDAIALPRAQLILHGGGAISRDHFVVQEFVSGAGTFGTGGFVGACSAGPGICDSVWDFLGNEGVEGRVVPRASWPWFFVGLDYTHYA